VKVYKQKGVANHCFPESCVDVPQGVWRSVDRGCAGWAIELRNHQLRMSTMLNEWEDYTHACSIREYASDPSESENQSMYINFICGSREIQFLTLEFSPRFGQLRIKPNIDMNESWKSDNVIVPKKCSNNDIGQGDLCYVCGVHGGKDVG